MMSESTRESIIKEIKQQTAQKEKLYADFTSLMRKYELKAEGHGLFLTKNKDLFGKLKKEWLKMGYSRNSFGFDYDTNSYVLSASRGLNG